MSEIPTPRTDALKNKLLQSESSISWLEAAQLAELALTLERELAEAKTTNVIASQTLDELQPVLNKLLADRDRWQKMAEELAISLSRIHCVDLARMVAPQSACDYCVLLSRFNAMKSESK